MFGSILTTLGFASGTAASSSIMQPPAMLQHKLIRNDIFLVHDELLRRALLADQYPRARHIQEQASCPGTPFLWKIIEDATGNHVGFGVGTMHVPADIVTTEEAYGSIISAVSGL
jgi:hypothetical protein